MHPLLNITGRVLFFHSYSLYLHSCLSDRKDCDVFLSIPPHCEMRRVFYLCRINLIRNMEQVNHPQHYTTYDVETHDMMIRIWGTQETISFCKLNAFKYRMRAGHKDNAEQDINKALWYENKMKELSSCNTE